MNMPLLIGYYGGFCYHYGENTENYRELLCFPRVHASKMKSGPGLQMSTTGNGSNRTST